MSLRILGLSGPRGSLNTQSLRRRFVFIAVWFDPDMSGFRSELRNSTSFGTALLLYSEHPELDEGHERLREAAPRTAIFQFHHKQLRSCYSHHDK